MDISLTHWGRPHELKAKLSMSFYLISDMLSPDLSDLKNNPPIQTFLTSHKLQMFPHTLKQSDSKPIAFFLGKAPTHTWRKDLQNRFQEYFDEYLNDNASIHNIFGEDHQAPKKIPFYF